MSDRPQKLVKSLTGSFFQRQRSLDSWAAVDRQARSLALVSKLAQGYLFQKEAEGLDNLKKRLLSLAEKIVKQLKSMSIADPSLKRYADIVQEVSRDISSWDPMSKPQKPQSEVERNVDNFKKNYPFKKTQSLLEAVRSASKYLKSKKSSLGKLPLLESSLRKMARSLKTSAPLGEPPGGLTQKLQEQGPAEQDLSVLGKYVSLLETELSNLRNTFPTNQPNSPKRLVFRLEETINQLNNYISQRSRTASLKDLRSLVGRAQTLIREAAGYLYRNRTASIHQKNVAISRLANLDEGFAKAYTKIASSYLRGVQNSLFKTVQRLSSHSKSLKESGLVKNLRLAWGELEQVGRGLTKQALTDMSDSGDEVDPDALAEEIKDMDPEDLTEALQEVMSSKVAKGKKKPPSKKKSPSKKKKAPSKKKSPSKKKTKKKPAISDDPWSGKKQTFDSAYKKVDKARSQLDRLMSKLTENSMVKGDVRYALSMLEKVMAAMHRC